MMVMAAGDVATMVATAVTMPAPPKHEEKDAGPARGGAHRGAEVTRLGRQSETKRTP